MNGGDPSGAVDHERGRQRFKAAVLIARFVVAKHNTIIDLSFFDEGSDRLPAVVVHRNPQDFEAPVLVLALEFLKPRDLDHARTAPGSPKIEQNHFAPIVGKMHELAIRIFQGEIGSMLSLAVIPDDRARGSGRRAGDNTENRGHTHDGRQTQLGSKVFHST
jgi:hypothetical protein